MSHLVSYKWFRRTQYIPQFGGVLQECGDRVGIVRILLGVIFGGCLF